MKAVTITTSLCELLKNGGVRIPVIQRDYAQGRIGKEDLRKRFLSRIKEKLSSNETLLLDFVYGTQNDGKIAPLDGQQRLTTLWLLMWYEVFRDKENPNRDYRFSLLRKFTYETRSSSKEFVEWLCSEPVKASSNSSDLLGLTSFQYEWKQDPTVQAMIRMISGTFRHESGKSEGNADGIEQIFSTDYKLLESLFDESNCPIRFYYLPLNGINQTDSLYVKMNARGEQLTDFENFKADMVDYLRKTEDMSEFVTVGSERYILQKWDRTWTDIFWNIGKDNVDALFFSFIKRFLLNRYILENQSVDESNDAVYRELSDEAADYSSIDNYASLLDSSTLDDLTKVLDLIAKMSASRLILPEYVDKSDGKNVVKNASYQERIMMYGVCQYLQNASDENGDGECFDHWLRVLYNLVYYHEISKFKDFVYRLKFIDLVVAGLLKNEKSFPDVYMRGDVLRGLVDGSQNGIQLAEEIRKIDMVNAGVNETGLRSLEKLWIFSGHIDCLCDLIQKHLIPLKWLSVILRDCIGDKITWIKDSPALITFFQAVLSQTDIDNHEELMLNDEHNKLRILLNGVLREAFIKTVLELRGGYSLSDLIKNCRAVGYKRVLVQDKSLWKYAVRGKFKVYDDKPYLFRGSYKNDADIPLEKYAAFFANRSDYPSSISYDALSEKWILDFITGQEEFI